MTEEEEKTKRVQQLLSSLQISGNITQLNLGDGYMTQVYHGPAAAPATADTPDEALSRVFARATAYIRHHPAHWSHLYYYMRRQELIPADMSASAFGEFVEAHGGPRAQTVRKSGDYQLSSSGLVRERQAIEAMGALFSDD